MRRNLHLTLLLFAACGALSASFAFQTPGGRAVGLPPKPAKTASATPTPARTQTTTRTKNKPVKPSRPQPAQQAAVRQPLKAPSKAPAKAPLPLSDLTISANPPESSITLDGHDYSDRAENGSLTFTGIKPGEHTITVRNATHREATRTIQLGPNKREFVNITLEPLPGVLSVSPGVGGAEIVVRDSETSVVVGRYTDAVRNLEVAPGRYLVQVSKDGYNTAERRVTLRPAETVYLEPPLERSTPVKPRVQGDSAMTVETLKDGKYLIISLAGKSGDPSLAVGAVTVMLDANNNLFNAGNVAGLLPGFPCQVEFVRIENVAEYSFKEAPGTGNRWGRVVVRVRPKDAKRPVHFSINWRVLQSQ
jgi:hypothetical protein